MGKPILIIAAGILLLFMGCRTMSGYETEIDHLYRGETHTILCRSGEPVEGVGIETPTAIERCADEQSRQGGATRVLLVLGVLAIGWGGFELRQSRSS